MTIRRDGPAYGSHPDNMINTMKQVLPDNYRSIAQDELISRIKKIKNDLGKRLVILGHHYQNAQIVALSDFKGDSFQLSRLASEQTDARDIVFCGVNFMAESAAILAQDYQRIIHPDTEAGCPMADMADLSQVEECWNALSEVFADGEIVPITYMNSSAAIKAFCGSRGGLVCTSSNADKAFRWGFERYGRILFLPDEHLGRNTANIYGIPRRETALWDPTISGGGVSTEELKAARLILWKGYCHVHTYFRPEHVRRARTLFPDARIIVHPECPEEVVAAADECGSTGYIDREVTKAPAGSRFVIGTEINMVMRLAQEHPDKIIQPLARSLCPNMFKVSLNDLLWVLENLGDVNVVILPDEIKQPAKLALTRMLELQ
jgi:quinolinate synthase